MFSVVVPYVLIFRDVPTVLNEGLLYQIKLKRL
jgi:hypothetical protein